MTCIHSSSSLFELNLSETTDAKLDNVVVVAVVVVVVLSGGGGTQCIPLGGLKSETGALSTEKSVKSICHKCQPGTEDLILAVRTGMSVSIRVLKLYCSFESQYCHSSQFTLVPLYNVMSCAPW